MGLPDFFYTCMMEAYSPRNNASSNYSSAIISGRREGNRSIQYNRCFQCQSGTSQFILMDKERPTTSQSNQTFDLYAFNFY